MSLPRNFIARPYRGVSVQRWEGELTPAALERSLRGREAYRRTEFLVLRRGEQTALVRVGKESLDPLLSPVTEVEVLAGPDECVYLHRADVDTGNASALARAALENGGGARAYVVEGLFHHVNFIFEPSPIVLRVVEVVPPEPPKLLEMAARVVGFDEDLPPIRLELQGIDIREIARAHPAGRYLLPCRGSGIDLPAPVDFLDERPPERDWTLIGCERSRQFFEWFYHRQPERIELCPRKLAGPGGPTLVKCCLLERGLERDGQQMAVPWGANLKEVQQALHLLVSEPAGELASTRSSP
jgi:hypothetical protein